MNTMHNPEDLLRDTLQARAAGATVDLTFDEIRRNAGTQRRRSTRRTALLAAAAVVVAVGAPTAFLLRPDDGTPSPAPQPTATPTDTASSSPDQDSVVTPAPGSRFLEDLPTSAAPRVTYLYGKTVHLESGGTTTFPQPANVTAFAAYHGGWLVGNEMEPGVQWYDNTGTLRQQGAGSGRLAASSDGMRIAYRMGTKIHVGIASGMGEGEQLITIGDAVDGWPVGFLSSGALVYADDDGVKSDQPLSAPIPASMAGANAVSVDDVVAGVDDQGHGMAWSARTGKTLWSGSKWVVTAFSSDGRYAAAADHPEGGSAVAILDTQTGDVIAHHAFSESQATAGYLGMVFDTDGSLLASVQTDSEDEAVLRLSKDGSLTRATPVLRFDINQDPLGIVFATGP